ncbi:uncharacterized protein V1510DRAFT_414312 [Dipodascopsis tothii]|uniref:uncharacterized protein n=1 Tax=Dipodascopsis tothii TaxID=44089 RepID=UPI0034CD3CFB
MSSNTNGTVSKVISAGGSTRILCVADIRGNLAALNKLVREYNASHVIHTGDFGFHDRDSVARITDKTLRHVGQYSPLFDARSLPQESSALRQFLSTKCLSQLPEFISGEQTLDVPVYSVYGACEDVTVLEKFRSGEYKVPNLFIVDEHSSSSIDTGNGVKFRLLGLGGAVVMHKLFDNGSGRTTIAGGGGTTWTTLLQIGELIDTAARVFDETETRILITQASPAREGILAQLALALKADFSISGGLHFRYGSSYSEFAVNPTYDYFRAKLAGARAQFMLVWNIVKSEVLPAVANNLTQKQLLENALAVLEKMPTSADAGSEKDKEKEEQFNSGFKNMWHFNLSDVSYGSLVLNVTDGNIGMEMRSDGFNFKYRRAGLPPAGASASSSSKSTPLAQKVAVSIPSLEGADADAKDGAKPDAADDAADGKTESADEKDGKDSKRPGLWVARADESEETLLGYFRPADQEHITGVVIRTGVSGRPFAYVYFDTQENAQAALEALEALDKADQQKIGRVTMIADTNRQSRSFPSWGRSGSESEAPQRRGSFRTGARISGGSRTVGRARGMAGRGSRGGNFNGEQSKPAETSAE